MKGPTFDQWVEDNSPTDPRKLHAVGLVAYKWNQCEFWLFHLFCNVSELPEEKGWALVYDLGNVAICTRIAVLSKRRGFHPEAGAIIDNALKYFDLCRQNRNALVHAWPDGAGYHGKFARKSREAEKKDPVPFPSDVGHIRRVGEQVSWLATRLWLLNVFLEEERMDQPLPSLEKLTLPELLLKPPPQTNAKPKRQPRSSPASRRKDAIWKI